MEVNPVEPTRQEQLNKQETKRIESREANTEQLEEQRQAAEAERGRGQNTDIVA